MRRRICLPALLSFALIVSFVPALVAGQPGTPTTEENKALVRRWVEEVWDRRNLNTVTELLASDFVDHNPDPGQAPGPAGAKRAIAALQAAFPDGRLSVEDLVAEGDRVAVRLTFRGTHQGELFGIPPTSKPVIITAFDIVRIADGQIAERWGLFDGLGLLTQLGVLPAEGASPVATPDG